MVMGMVMADTMAIAILIMADITMANRFQEFQSLIFEKSYYETIEHWREIWTENKKQNSKSTSKNSKLWPIFIHTQRLG